MTAPAAPEKRRSWWADNEFERMTDRNVDKAGYRQLHDDLAAKGIDLSPQQAGNWAAAGFTAAEARECIEAGFAPNESGSAADYTAAGLYSPQEAFMERLVDQTEQLVYEADDILERQAERDEEFHEQYETDPETGMVKPRPEPRYDEGDWWPEPEPQEREYSQAEIDQANEWGEIEAARAQEQGERLADEDDARAERDPWAPDPAEQARFDQWRADNPQDTLDDIDSAIGDAEATAAGWTAEDQAAFEAEVDATGTGEPNPLYVEPGGPDAGLTDFDDVPATWPPAGREPTEEELASGVAIRNEDGSTSWSPTNADFDWTDEEEMRAAGHPAAQAPDYSEEPYDREQYQEDTLRHAVGTEDEDGGDLVVGGVVYDRDEWMPDGEGGVMSRVEWRAEQGFDDEDQAAEQRGGLDFTGDLAEVQAGLAESSLPRPPARPELSEEAEEIARGVEQREAEADAMEADEDMVGSEAWAERQFYDREPDDEPDTGGDDYQGPFEEGSGGSAYADEEPF